MICSDNAAMPVMLDSIQCDDNYFKISKPLSKDLSRSVLHYGVIEPILLLQRNDSLIPVYGHNRIKAAQEAGLKDVLAMIITKITIDVFLNIIRIKSYHNLIGTIGKIKSIYLLYEYFHADKKVVTAIAQELSLPEILIDMQNSQAIIKLPTMIVKYIDTRAIAPKFVVPLLRMPNIAITVLEKIVTACQPRVNYFNNMVVMIEDICRLGREKFLLERLESLLTKEFITDDDIYDCIYSIRYPDYISSMDRINEIKKKLTVWDIKVDVPRFLEGNTVNVIVEVQKNKPIPQLLQNDDKVKVLIKSIVDLL